MCDSKSSKEKLVNYAYLIGRSVGFISLVVVILFSFATYLVRIKGTVTFIPLYSRTTFPLTLLKEF